MKTVRQNILDSLSWFRTKIDSIYVKFTNVVNNLASTSTTYPLSAYQGKVLKGYIDELNTKKANLENGTSRFLLGDETITAELRRSGSSGAYALGLIVKNGNTSSYNTLINSNGSCNFVMRAGKSTAIGSTTKPVYVNAAGNVAECAGIHILDIQTITANTTGTVAAGNTGTITAKFSTVSGATKYAVIPIMTNYGSSVYQMDISGTTITAKAYSVYGTHTLTVTFLVLAYA